MLYNDDCWQNMKQTEGYMVSGTLYDIGQKGFFDAEINDTRESRTVS